MKIRSLTLFLALVTMCGCTGTGLGRKSGNVGPLRDERREQAMRQFETHRDTAQYKSAIECWRTGDRFTCEAQLKSLVARNPKHLEARQALADLAMEHGDLSAAEEQLRELLKQAPNDPQTHHSLGLLLESQEKHDEAQQHLRRAAELDPDSTLYQLCLQRETPATTAATTTAVAATAER